MSLTRWTLPFAVLAVSIAVGCDIVSDECAPDTAPPSHSLLVSVTDAETGVDIAEGATGTARDGEFAETLEPVDLGGEHLLGLPTLRDGEYEITVHRDGYETWQDVAVVSVRTRCWVGSGPIFVEASLVPAA